jgi:hypothetical protein
MWIRSNMMHENNTMSQQQTLKINHNPTSHRTDNSLPWRWVAFFVLMAMGSQGFAQPTMGVQDGLDAYRVVDRWVNDWGVPREDELAEGVPACAAAIVTLRLDGRVFGRGSSASLDPSPVVLLEATRRAIASASAKLTGERDALWDEFIKDLTGRITITLELGDALVPISDSELDLPGFGYTPGVLGVAVRRADRIELLGPESMLMRHTDMTQSAMALGNALAGDASVMLSTPRELSESGYTLYRFEPIVLAEPGVSMGAVFIDRGGRVVESDEIQTRTIGELASKVATHLMSRRWAGIEHYGLMGTLDPVTGRSESSFAAPFEQAIGAYALLRFGEDGKTALERDARRAGLDILGDLAIIEDGEARVADDPLGACMTLIALSEIQLVDILADEGLNALRIESLAVLDGLYLDSTGFDPSVPEASHGLVALALVRSAMLDPVDRRVVARSAIIRIFQETPAPALVAQMPFLGWAQLEADLDAISDTVANEHADWLSQMRSLVWGHQLKRADLAWMDRDLAGGIVFTSAKTPLPSWLSMRPLAFIATMLGDERLTPGSIASGEVPSEIGTLVDSIRFIAQLSAAQESGHMYASGDGAKWGVRMALWDQRMPVEADAMALLTLDETGRSFKRIIERSTP